MVTKEHLERLYERMPGRESVTLQTIRGADKTTVNTTVDHAWQRSVTQDDINAGYVQSRSEGQVWHIPAVLIPVAGIETGDRITDSGGVVWQVRSAENVRMRSHWRCVCRREK